MDESSEVQKWQQHLALLRQQYVALHKANAELQQKYAAVTATKTESGFIGRLMTNVAALYGNKQYSDATVKLGDQEIPVHKFVLTARSDIWKSISEKDILDWTDLTGEVGPILLKWIYTDNVPQEHLSLELMKAACNFKLAELVSVCESYLIGTVCLQNCVQVYTVAEELHAETLRDHCSSLISSHWEDLTGEDFKEMPGPLLYQLLKSKSEYPLNSAIRLMREDVVFLYLIEHNAQKNCDPVRTEKLMTQTGKSFGDVSDFSSLWKKENCVTQCTDKTTPPRIKKEIDDTPIPIEVTPTDKHCSLYNMPLLQFLENSLDGKEILATYAKNDNVLTQKATKKLVRLLIDREKHESVKNLKQGEILESWAVPKTRLTFLAHEIEATFSGQLSTSYYSPFCIEGGKRIAASGKLIDHLNYVKRLMVEDGLLKSGKKNKEENAVELPIKATDSQDLEFLKNHSEPFSDVKKAFLRTTDVRKHILQEEKMSVYEYMLRVKALRLDQPGQELINLDFENKYKNVSSKLREKWPLIREFLINRLKTVKTLSKEDALYVLTLPTLDSEKQDVLLFYLLHYITKTERRKRKRTTDNDENLMKCSSDERRSSYLLHIDDVTELETTLGKLKTNLSSGDVRLQPLTVIVGPLLNIQAIYVIADDIKYTCKSILDAVDLNFKIFFVFDCAYPNYSECMWSFLQTVIYEIRRPGEKIPILHRQLEGEIKRILV